MFLMVLEKIEKLGYGIEIADELARNKQSESEA